MPTSVHVDVSTSKFSTRKAAHSGDGDVVLNGVMKSENLDDDPGLAKGKVRNRFRDHLTDLPILEAEYAQLGAGPANVIARYFFGKDIIITQTAIEPKFVAHCFIDPDWLGLMIPLRWRGDYVFNGVAANPYDVFVSEGSSGYAATGLDRETLSIAVRRAPLCATMQALRGNSSDPIRFFDQRMALGATNGPRFQKVLLSAIRTGTQIVRGEGQYVLSEAMESNLFDELGYLFLDQLDRGPPRDPGRIDTLRVVSAAKRALDEQRLASVSMSDLCAASGVGKTWLHKCFHEAYGCAPQAYLRAQRLTAARDRLLCPLAPPALIKEVALSLGFVNFGRFAADYRARFGENPSQTLRPQPSCT